MRIVAIVQARMGSARLPGKMLADIGGRPALAHVLTRAAAITPVDDVILAIPESPEDDTLERVGEGCGVRVIRGDRDDVLGRYWTAAAASAPTRSSASPAIVRSSIRQSPRSSSGDFSRAMWTTSRTPSRRHFPTATTPR